MSDLITEQKPSRRLWILAGLGALALHIGCAGLVIAHMQTDDPDDSPIRITIEGYRLVREISRWGQAVVYLGVMLRIGRMSSPADLHVTSCFARAIH